MLPTRSLETTVARSQMSVDRQSVRATYRADDGTLYYQQFGVANGGAPRPGSRQRIRVDADGQVVGPPEEVTS